YAIHDSRDDHRVLLVSVKVSPGDHLIVAKYRRFSYMRLLSEVAFEPFYKIVNEKYLHVPLARQFLSRQLVLFWTEAGAETHTDEIDRLASEMEHLWCWVRIL